MSLSCNRGRGGGDIIGENILEGIDPGPISEVNMELPRGLPGMDG
jgi:hypothetical protein